MSGLFIWMTYKDVKHTALIAMLMGVSCMRVPQKVNTIEAFKDSQNKFESTSFTHLTDKDNHKYTQPPDQQLTQQIRDLERQTDLLQPTTMRKLTASIDKELQELEMLAQHSFHTN
jgi:hypothetical protein